MLNEPFDTSFLKSCPCRYILLSRQRKVNTVSLQALLRSEGKSNFWLKQNAAKATFFCFIFRVRERILGSVKADRKNRNLILLWRLILGNLTQQLGKFVYLGFWEQF